MHISCICNIIPKPIIMENSIFNVWANMSRIAQVRALRVALAVGFAMQVSISVYTQAVGPTNRTVSNKHPTLLSPASYAYMLWGFIWTLQAVYVVHTCVSNITLDIRFRFAERLIPLLISVWLFQSLWQLMIRYYLLMPCTIVIFIATVLGAVSIGMCEHVFAARGPLTGFPYRQQTNWAENVLYASLCINTAWLGVAWCVQSLVYMHAHSTQEELDRNAPLFAMFATLGLVWYCLHTVFNTGNVFTPLVAVWALTAIQHKHAQDAPGEYVLAQYIQALNAICVLVCVYATIKTAVMKTEWAGRTTWAAAKVDNDGYESVD